MVGHCRDLVCTGFDTDPMLGPNRAADDTALAIGSDGLPLVAYADFDRVLWVARCADVPCRQATVTTLDQGAASSQAADGS